MEKLKSVVSNQWIALALIIIIAAFLRLYNIGELPPGLYPDEAMNGNNALEALSANGSFKFFYPENNGREGLFINIQAMSVAIFGNEPWALRLVSALFGILTVLGVYFLTKEFFYNKSPHTRKIALLSSFFLATSFWHINFSRIGFRAIMAPFFLIWGIYFLLLAFRQIKEQKSPKFYILSSIFSGIFYGLGMHSYIAYRATPLLILLIIGYWLFANWDLRKEIIKIFAVFSIFAFLVFSPLGIHFLKNPADFFGRTTQVSVFSSETPMKDLGMNILKTLGMFNFSGDYNWRHNYAGRPQIFWPVGILFIIGIIYGMIKIFKKSIIKENNQRFEFLILFSWLIIVSLPTVISNEGLPHALRAILMIPPAFILAGLAGIWFYEKISEKLQNSLKFKKIFLITCFLILFLLVVEAYTTYFILWGKSEHTPGAFAADYVELGRELKALPKELPKYVIVKANGVNVRGIPMPTQTIMFITDTFTSEKQKEKNLYYLLPDQINQIPQSSYSVKLK